MKFSLSSQFVGAILAATAAAQDPNIVPVAGPQEIPTGNVIIQPTPTAQTTYYVPSIPPVFRATSCPGEVKCGTDPIRVGITIYNETITTTSWNTVPYDTTVNVTMTSYVIAVSTTVAAREGVCPTEYDAPVEIDTTVTVHRDTTSTQWWVAYQTETVTNVTYIGVTASEGCVSTQTRISVPTTPTPPGTTSVAPAQPPSDQQPIVPPPVQSPSLPEEEN